jgi:rubrerythrin
MKTEIKSALDALEEAKCLEQEGQDFYLRAADESRNEKAKETFQSLAHDEAMHLRLIQRQIDSLASTGKWVHLAETEGETCDLSESIYPQGREGLKKAVPSDTSETEALLLALDFENKGYDMYRLAAQGASDDLAREMYEFLATQERLHFDLLMSNYESIVALGGWAD